MSRRAAETNGAASDVCIRVQNLSKQYGSGPDAVTAVDDVSFTIERGSVVGILGPNGAGKTTLIKSVLGLITPETGSAEINGVDAHSETRELYREVSAMLEGARNAYWRLTVMENLDFFASLHGHDPNEFREEHEELVERLDLTDKREETVRNLSRGMKQKVSLACSLVQQTPVVFLDEPTLGLDVKASRDLQAELSGITGRDRTVVLSSHNMDVVQKLCDRVIVLDDGQIIADDSVDELVNVFDTRAYRLTIDGPLPDSVADEYTVDESTTVNTETEFGVTINRPTALHELFRELEAEGRTVTHIDADEPDLEDAFVRLTESRPTREVEP
jgi:ABC-2 type transport system ATP-binding protein